MSSIIPAQLNEPLAKKKPRRGWTLAKTRECIDIAKRWYIHGLIPAGEGRGEIRQPSLEDVATHVGLPTITIHRRSRFEGWVEQREAFAALSMEVENQRLVRTIADQHARSRVAYFRSSMRLQTAVERKLAQECEVLGMVELSRAASALAKAQKVTDSAFLGPSIPQRDHVQNSSNLTGGWAHLARRPSPQLQAFLAKLDKID